MRALSLVVLSACVGCTVVQNQIGTLDGGADAGTPDGGVDRSLKPAVMFLLDKSGSMNFPSKESDPNCPAGCGNTTAPCPAACPTRISELRSAMNTFLAASGTTAWTGLAIFPTTSSADQCGPTVAGDVLVQLNTKKTDLDADLTATASLVNTQVQLLAPGGGTPTAESLRFLETYSPLASNPDHRRQFVVLLSDGVPNCNENNLHTCANGTPAGNDCHCTLAVCSMANTYCAKGCLDSTATQSAAAELAGLGIRTFVIGFGADLETGDGPETLNAIANVGGTARKCPNGTDDECGANNTCNAVSRVCSKGYYQAISATDLQTALGEMYSAMLVF